MPLDAGSRLGPYEILAPIGAGGMGEVYRARDTRLQRDFAVKVLPDAFAGDPADILSVLKGRDTRRHAREAKVSVDEQVRADNKFRPVGHRHDTAVPVAGLLSGFDGPAGRLVEGAGRDD